jgi:hypothetical protein
MILASACAQSAPPPEAPETANVAEMPAPAAVLAPAPMLAPAPPPVVTDALASWNDRAPKRAITDFVARVTKEGSPDFVPVSERIAVFDNDGTLWSEQPVYIQIAFALDRVRELAPQHPEWKTK